MVVLRHAGIRLLTGIGTLVAAAILIFFGIQALPGDAVTTALGAQSSNQELVQQRRAELGLDRPVLVQFGDWISGLAHGDLGTSFVSGEPVSELISDKLVNTAFLALAVLLFLVPLSIVLGVASALKRDGWFDSLTSAGSLVLTVTPEFVVGPLLVALFTTRLHILPGVSLLDPSKSVLSQLNLLALPVATLVLIVVAQATRMIRAATSEVLQSSYVQLAQLRGTPTRILLRRHVLPNALGPTIQVLALTVAFLVGGIVVTETVFQYPGIGTTLVAAVGSRDTPTVSAIALIIAGVYVLANVLADVGIMTLNPRLRRAKQ